MTEPGRRVLYVFDFSATFVIRRNVELRRRFQYCLLLGENPFRFGFG